MWGICMNTTFHQTLDLLLLWSPIQQQDFYSRLLLYKRRLRGPPGSWISPPIVCLRMLLWGIVVWGLSLNLWASAQACPQWVMAVILSGCPHPVCPPEDQHWSEPSAEEQCGLCWVSGSSRLLLSPQILGLIPGSSEIKASLPIDISRAKFSSHWEDWVLCMCWVNITISSAFLPQ